MQGKKSKTYSYAGGQTRVRPSGEHIDGKGDGKAGQTSMHQGLSGQWCQSISCVYKQDGLLVQEAGDHLLPWRVQHNLM